MGNSLITRAAIVAVLMVLLSATSFAQSGFHKSVVKNGGSYHVGKNTVCEFKIRQVKGKLIEGDCTAILLTKAMYNMGLRAGQKIANTTINSQSGEITSRAIMVTPYCKQKITVYYKIKDVRQSSQWHVRHNGKGCLAPVLARSNCSRLRCGVYYDRSGKTKSKIFISKAAALADFRKNRQ